MYLILAISLAAIATLDFLAARRSRFHRNSRKALERIRSYVRIAPLDPRKW